MQVRNYNYRQEKTFDWDGLALINRSFHPTDGSTAKGYSNTYINEPAITGGNPILSNDTVMFNDMLGSTYATSSNGNITSIERTQFGVTDTKTEEFFTGKPHIEDMGYAFLFRNYRSELSKWQSADPIGYPDGLNNFAYVNNGVTDTVDLLGLCDWEYVPPTIAFPEGQYVFVPCSELNPYASANITKTVTSKSTYTAVCGTSISGSKSFEFSVSANIADIFEISTSFSESIDIGTHIFDVAPHDGTGNGFIKIGATYSFTYYELGFKYDCGEKKNVTYHTVEKNFATKVIDTKGCVHE